LGFVIEAGPYGRNGWIRLVTVRCLQHYTITFLREEATLFTTESEARGALLSIPKHWDPVIVQIHTYPGDDA
jgi:hypothetical protein